MAAAALVLYGVSLALTLGVRVAVQLRRTGSTGVHGLDGRFGSLEWFAGALFLLSMAMGAAAPTLTLLGVLEPIAVLDSAVGHVAGTILAASGIVLTFLIQLAMGDSWRVGVDPDERTQLITAGPFELVRNPIYSAIVPTVLGLVLMVPNVLSIAGLATLATALELQVRMVEEPHLLRVHGSAYADYAARVGRFVPGVGLMHGPPGNSREWGEN